MIIRKDEESVAIDNETTLYFRRIGYDAFTLETTDYNGTQVFTIPETEKDVHALFVSFFNQVSTIYAECGYKRMKELSHDPHRLTLETDTDYTNTVVMELDSASGDVVLTFINDPKNHNHNNRVVLDIDGNLYGGYFAAFRELLEGLQNTPSKELRISTRMRNFLPNKKR